MFSAPLVPGHWQLAGAALAALLTLAAQSPRAASLSGAVTDPDGAPLPGVEVIAEGGAGRWTDYTDIEGTYGFDGLSPGSYEVRAELEGFCPEIRTDVELAAGATSTADFSLWLAAVDWQHRYEAERLQIIYALSDAVVHLRIASATDASLWEINGRESVGIEYEATVIAATNPIETFSGGVLRFVQYPAGYHVDETGTHCGSETIFSAGEEYVAFLRRIDDSGSFGFPGPRFMIPVSRGRLVGGWLNETEVPGVRDGMPAGTFLDILRDLPAAVGSEADADDARVAALRYLIDQEIDRLARAGLPRGSERLSFCLATARPKSAAGTVPTRSPQFNESFGRREDPPRGFVERLQSEVYDLFPSSSCNGSSDIGAPIHEETGRGTRGLISIGPAYHVDGRNVQIPASIFRHLVSAEASILYLEKHDGTWRVVSERFIWGA